MYVSKERLQELINLITSGDHLAFYSSKEWRHTRQLIRERDNNECQECKRNGLVYTDKTEPDKRKRLEVDHILELETHPELCLTLDNLETLCVKCHNKKHKRFKHNKPKWDDERW